MEEEAPREFADAPLGQPRVSGDMHVAELVDAYAAAGGGAVYVAEAVDILTEMFDDHSVTTVMGLAGAMVPTGMRTIIADLIADGLIDILVTTGATLTHDTIDAIGGAHHHGRPDPSAPHPAGAGHPDTEDRRAHDEQLRAEGVDRIYNVYLPQEHFAAFERHLRAEVFPQFDGPTEIAAVTAQLGRANAAVAPDARTAGIAAAAATHDVPVYCPAIQDSVLGIQAWMYSQISDFTLDALADMTALSDRAFAAERAGAFVVGGGVPKNYTLQTMLTIPGAYDLGVQLTMDPEHTGGLSGASLDEARSWGKLEPDARNVTVLGDATITMPLVIAAARSRLTHNG